MRVRPVVILATALGLFVAAPNADANGANPRRASTAPRASIVSPLRRQGARTRESGAICETSAAHSFLGIPGQEETPGGDASTVPGGFEGEACWADTGIVTGYQSEINRSTSSVESFIGTADEATIIGVDSGIGAGLTGSVDASYAFLAGGYEGLVTANGAFVGGGGETDTYSNAANGVDSFVGGGRSNTGSGLADFLGAGFGNTTGANAAYAVIMGGEENSVTGEFGSVLGGNDNTASGAYATIGGGNNNDASGSFSTIPGGADDEAAGAASFAAGYHADAAHDGSFVWSDDVSGSSLVRDAAANQVVVRASGGTAIFSSENLTSGVTLAAGSGTWSSLSDRNAKRDIVPLDDASILAKLSLLPIDTWRYKTESGVRHIGPMAQDFRALFELGDDDRRITSIDEDGVALAAIKALAADARRKDMEARRLAFAIGMQDAEIARLARAVRGRDTSSICTANAAASFVAIAGEGDVAGGDDSTVLAGNGNEACGTYTAVGAGVGNVAYDSVGFTQNNSFIGAGFYNTTSNGDDFIGAGQSGMASGNYAVIGGGVDAEASGDYSFVGAGGYLQYVAGGYSAAPINAANAEYSVIGAGDRNTISSYDSFIGGGQGNSLPSTSNSDATIGGGSGNSNAASYATILGGNNNAINDSSIYAAIGGGGGNKAQAPYATIPGGADNDALGTAAFAAGYHAKATHAGSFVWSDDVSGSSLVSDAATNQFIVRASGGAAIYSSEKLTSGVKLAAGSGTWSSLSDRNAKTEIATLDDAAVLARVSALPVAAWQYRSEPGVRHVGPMAQDFYAAFGVGEDERHITSIDEDGVTLAAIEALAAQSRRTDAEIEDQRRDLAARDREIAALTRSLRLRDASTTCTANASTSFVAIPGESDVAGGAASSVLGGKSNHACTKYSTIVSGTGNLIVNDSSLSASAIGAGADNTIDASDAFIGDGIDNTVDGRYGFVGGGVGNLAEGAGSFVGAGGSNHYAVSKSATPGNEAVGTDSFVGAGDENVAGGVASFVGAGQSNTIATAAENATIVGGQLNAISASLGSISGGYGGSVSGEYGTIGGGGSNSVRGSFATVPGGADNSAAGAASFAAGYHADAAHTGSFVWSDDVSGSSLVSDSAANQFVVRASGGTVFYSNEAATSGVELAAGSGTWASLSDRNAKTAIVPLDDDAILAKVATLPVDAWSYKTEGHVRHAGPMAQDFYAAFGVGEDDRHITSIDEDGVALAAIKALYVDAVRTQRRLWAARRESARQAATLVTLHDAPRPPAPRRGLPARQRVPSFGTRTTNTTTCSTNDAASFIGISGESNVAGGEASSVVGGTGNEACGQFSSIVAGTSNLIDGTAGTDSVIGAGESNTIEADHAFIGAGDADIVGGSDAFAGAGDLAKALGEGSFVGSSGPPAKGAGSIALGIDAFVGSGQTNVADANESFVGGGASNTIGSGATYATIVGGYANSATGTYASIAGGYANSAAGTYAAVGGGNGNKASGAFATVPGGADNRALGTVSFAAGYHAEAANSGSFVWSDDVSGSSLVKDTAANQFVVRASGGSTIYSNESMTTGVTLAAGSGTWESLSDRNAKTAIVPVDDAAILAKLAALPIDAWQYKAEPGVRHAGPMAQDFYAAFGTGRDDRHIASIDEDGVALASLRALAAKARSNDARLAAGTAKIARQDAQIDALRTAFHAVDAPVVAQTRSRLTATKCTTNAAVSFVAIPAANEVAGGTASAAGGGAYSLACENGSAIAGGEDNLVAADLGGANAFIAGGVVGTAESSDSFVAGGLTNVSTGAQSAVGSGVNGYATGQGAFVGAGGYTTFEATESSNADNQAEQTGAFVGAGDVNVAGQSDTFVGAGQNNTVQGSSAVDSSILGGNANTVGAAYAAIAGGNGNAVSANGPYAAIGGGNGNKAQGAFSTIPGGADDAALGAASFAGGYHAEAVHNGSFVWSDDVSGSAIVKDTAPNQFVVRASGGAYVWSDEALTDVVGLQAGSGTWVTTSDRNVKSAIVPLDDRAVLANVDALPVDLWQYRTETGVEHAGPMAQDFYAGFGVGEDDRHIGTVDEDGIVLAAIQALAAQASQQDAALAAQTARIDRRDRDIAALRRELAYAYPYLDIPQSRTRATGASCTMMDVNSFVAIAGESDVAHGDQSSVLGGNDNAACVVDSNIIAGESNLIDEDGRTGFSTIAAGATNEIDASYSFIGAGENNLALGSYAFIGGGIGNEVNAAGDGGFIGAGGTASGGNAVDGIDAFIGAGDRNSANALASFIGGGQANTTGTSATNSSIGGGNTNAVSVADAVITGGNNNAVSGVYGSIGGGNGNRVTGAFATIPGGADDVAHGAASFAAGYHAEAENSGSFTWSDFSSGSTVLEDDAAGEFNLRASGGTIFYSNEAATAGVEVFPGAGSWSSLSDRNVKTGIEPLDDEAVLSRLLRVPVEAWQYKTETGVRHIGPMAQDFYAAFGIGEDDRHITSIDEDGIALAAIKALSADARRADYALRNERRAAARQDDALASFHRELEHARRPRAPRASLP